MVWHRLGALVRRGRSSAPADAADSERGVTLAESLRVEVAGLRDQAALLRAQIDALAAPVEALLSVRRDAAEQAADFAALPTARLRSGLVTLEGPPSRRLESTRRVIGRELALPLRRWIGLTRCATRSEDVRAMWDRLLAAEAACTDALRGVGSSVLGFGDAVVSRHDTLHVALQPGPDAAPRVEAAIVPRFAYDFPPRKLRNFGHWLLDCVPHVLALSTIAPADARFLMPEPAGSAHWSALELAGITRERVLPWNGSAIACRRLFVQEVDGRVARGRPLAQLLDLRRHVAAAAAAAPGTAGRRIYISRRDAKRKRQWADNQDAIEALFASRGFEILLMRGCSMEEQVQAFRDARIVAGISGAGLANIAFAAGGTHVVTLISDSLMRWYAEEAGSRSMWASGDVPPAGVLNELSDSPRFYTHLAAACGQPCHTFVGGDEFPIEELARFLDDVLGRVGRG